MNMTKNKNRTCLFLSTFILCTIPHFSFASETKSTRALNASTIAVIVNNDVITHSEIEKRAALVLLSSGKDIHDMTPELLSQVRDALIQEKLQRQIAYRMEIDVSQEELNQQLAASAAENNMTLEQMKAFFESKGVPLSALAERIKTNILWIKTIRGAVASQIRISDRDVEAEKQRLIQNESKELLRLSEIVLFVDNPDKKAHVKNEIESLYTSLTSGTPFSVAARNFSQTPTGAKGGDIGWVAKDMLPPEVLSLKVGEFSRPIAQGNRYVIFACTDHKLPGQIAKGNRKVTFSTVNFVTNANENEQPSEALMSFIEESPSIRGCKAFEESAKSHGAIYKEHKDIPLSGIPQELMKLMQSAKMNNSTQPIRISQTELMFAMLCSQESIQKQSIPSDQEIRMTLMEKKVQEQATAQFNKLRAVATIEYRDPR